MAAALGLGTVQWGLRYGVANVAGKTPIEEVDSIVRHARRLGIRVLDTATQYGDAESVLGRSDLAGFEVVTKTPSFRSEAINSQQVAELVGAFQDSLDRLGCSHVHGLLLHHADDLLARGGYELVGAMDALKVSGRVRCIGVSVYDGQQLDAVLKLFRPDIVQLPLSVLDQRLLRSGHIDQLKKAGIEIHVRSVFLQGLLLMPLAEVPPYFAPIRSLLTAWHDAARAHGGTLAQAALSFVRDISGVDVVLVGVENEAQLAACYSDFTAMGQFDATGLSCDDPRFVNPAQWALN
jgi:aryl-alcohol dehydrogenase-like predicted oxidoreductase